MAKAIIGGGLKLLGIGKKKKKAETAAAEQKGPVVTQLAAGTTAPNMRRKLTTAQTAQAISAKLGTGGKLGG